MKTRYHRASPSPRYRRLLEQYRLMHERGEPHLGIPPDATFPGKSLPPQAGHIRRLVKQSGATTILDYGSGKGMQYLPQHIVDTVTGAEYADMREYWGVESIRCYDPAYAPFTALPESTYDGVISTDVLEHCPEEDMPWIVAELFSYSRRFVFANVACFPAQKCLPSGGNAHCTIRPTKWWRELILQCAASYPDIDYEFRLASHKNVAGSRIIKEAVISSATPEPAEG